MNARIVRHAARQLVQVTSPFKDEFLYSFLIQRHTIDGCFKIFPRRCMSSFFKACNNFDGINLFFPYHTWHESGSYYDVSPSYRTLLVVSMPFLNSALHTSVLKFHGQCALLKNNILGVLKHMSLLGIGSR